MPSFRALKRNRGTFVLLCLCVVAACATFASPLFGAEQTGVSVPRGFSVSLFADDDLAHDIYSMTLDSQGRVVVSGRGYVRILIDSDGDGEADSFQQFADGPKSGAQGLCFDGRDLLCTGDEGLLRYRDRDGDDRADGPPEVLLRIKTGGEHHAHAVRKGPDGWWYLIAGNYAGVTSRYVTLPTSPIRRPQSGVLMRLAVEGQGSNASASRRRKPTGADPEADASGSPGARPSAAGLEVVADGYRNAYDFAFDRQGDVFVYDSDGERDVSLPWYRPTRVFQALPGSNAGWVSRSWKRPGYFFDMPPVIGRLGRGSPTGVACYRHRRFPRRYHDAVFVCDWTFGRVVALPRSAPDTQSVRGTADGPRPTRAETFMTSVGQFGFAPTDVAVGPDGALYVSVGGRGTRGGVYRVTYTDANVDEAPDSEPDEVPGRVAPQETEPGRVAPQEREPGRVAPDRPDTSPPAHAQLERCLQAPQPLSSWSRARWVPIAGKLGREPFATFALDEESEAAPRVRAVEILTELFGGLTAPEAAALAGSNSPAVRARAAWSLGRTGWAQTNPDALAPFLKDESPLVVRCALEALSGPNPRKDRDSRGTLDALLPLIARQLDAEDRYVREAAARVVSRLNPQAKRALAELAIERGTQAAVSLHLGRLRRKRQVDPEVLTLGLSVLQDEHPGRLKLEAVRLMQLALGDVGPRDKRPPVFDGYASRLDLQQPAGPETPLFRELSFQQRLAGLYPTGEDRLDRELSRLLAMLAPSDPQLLDRVIEKIEADSHPVADIHQLIVAARIPAKRSARQRRRIARALVGIEPKITERNLNQDNNWDDRIGEMYRELVRLDPALAAEVVEQDGFGRPGHVIFLAGLPQRRLQSAIGAFVEAIRKEDDYPWTNEVVFLLGKSSEPAHRGLIREQFDSFAVRSAVLLVLAESPTLRDREKFVEGLSFSQLGVLEASLDALAELQPGREPSEQFALLRTLRRLNNDSSEYALREKAVRLLRRNMRWEFGFEFGKDGYRPQAEVVRRWTRALRARFPDEARRELRTAEAGLRRLNEMLQQVDWSGGDAGRGRNLFRRQACAQCHGGRRALGPDLAGAARRFSRKDLFVALALPDRDVSPRYQTTLIQTTEGKVYTGLVIYESVDGLTLRDGQNRTHRIEAEEIAARRTLQSSLMPAGLLKDLTPRDLADLYAYLREL